MQPILLASSSPARRTLMASLLLPFARTAPDVDETALANETPTDLVARLTQKKAQAVSPHYVDHLIISADQVIVVEGMAISKPETKDAAVLQLLQQSGKWITAYSGIAVLNNATQHYQYACVMTQVKFQTLTLQRIEAYLNKEPQAIHCAGSLRVEALGISLLEKINSDDPTALIGLPLITLCEMLRKEGVEI